MENCKLRESACASAFFSGGGQKTGSWKIITISSANLAGRMVKREEVSKTISSCCFLKCVFTENYFSWGVGGGGGQG